MYLLTKDGKVEKYPYGPTNLRRDNPAISFPDKPSDELLAEWGVLTVRRVDRPEINEDIERVNEVTPVLIDGQWTQAYEIVPIPEEEIAEIKIRKNRSLRERRAEDYRMFADPVFFKWQRGEATEEDWLWAIQQVKQQHPYYE